MLPIHLASPLFHATTTTICWIHSQQICIVGFQVSIFCWRRKWKKVADTFQSRTDQRYACISSWWQRVRVFSIQALFRFRWPPQGTSGYKHYHSCLKMFIVQDCKYCKLQIEKAISQEYTQGKSSSHGVLQTDGMCAIVQGGGIKFLWWRGQMRILSRGQLKDRFGIRHPPSEGP